MKKGLLICIVILILAVFCRIMGFSEPEDGKSKEDIVVQEVASPTPLLTTSVADTEEVKTEDREELSEENKEELCIELYNDDFFKDVPQVGTYVKFYGFISEKGEYTSSSTFGIIIEDIDNKYNFNKEYLLCCVMHEETRNDAVPSYFGESIYLMFPSDAELDISCYEPGQKVVVYGEVVQTWSGIFIIPKYIEEE